MDAREIEKVRLQAKHFLKQGPPPKPLLDHTLEKARKFLKEHRQEPPGRVDNEVVVDRWGNVIKRGRWVRPGTNGNRWLF